MKGKTLAQWAAEMRLEIEERLQSEMKKCDKTTSD